MASWQRESSDTQRVTAAGTGPNSFHSSPAEVAGSSTTSHHDALSYDQHSNVHIPDLTSPLSTEGATSERVRYAKFGGPATTLDLPQGYHHQAPAIADPGIGHSPALLGGVPRHLNNGGTNNRHTMDNSDDQDHSALDLYLDLVVGCSPDVLTDDGIFLPGSTYQELHKTLRTQIFQTAHSQPNSRRPSQCQTIVEETRLHGSDDPLLGADHEQDTLSTGSSTPPELTAAQEVMLWNNWIIEIASWVRASARYGDISNAVQLDKFDHNQHFRLTLPALAQSRSHLKYSMLALSARQLERKSRSLPTSTSLSLYQWAIHLLVPELHTRDISTLASCVILCVFEMSSCKCCELSH